MTLELLEKEAAQLTEDQRVTLAHRILMSVEPSPSPAVTDAWDDEIRQRIARYDRGDAKTIPVDQVFAEADEKLGR